jgi:hypothetical protein
MVSVSAKTPSISTAIEILRGLFCSMFQISLPQNIEVMFVVSVQQVYEHTDRQRMTVGGSLSV